MVHITIAPVFLQALQAFELPGRLPPQRCGGAARLHPLRRYASAAVRLDPRPRHTRLRPAPEPRRVAEAAQVATQCAGLEVDRRAQRPVDETVLDDL